MSIIDTFAKKTIHKAQCNNNDKRANAAYA